jgi:hypothetical protein
MYLYIHTPIYTNVDLDAQIYIISTYPHICPCELSSHVYMYMYIYKDIYINICIYTHIYI